MSDQRGLSPSKIHQALVKSIFVSQLMIKLRDQRRANPDNLNQKAARKFWKLPRRFFS
jgi:hypothetical protein